MSYTRYGCGCPLCASGGSGEHDSALASGWTTANVSATPVVAYSYTGDYRIDCMIEGLQYRWNSGSALGTPVTVTYSFMQNSPWYGGNVSEDSFGFSSFNYAQRTAVREIFTKLQTELNIRFVEVADSEYSFGAIRFGNNYQYSSSGYAWLPGSGGDLSGDVWLDAWTSSNLNPVQGTWGWETLVHEIGHALGLKHPGNYNAGTTAQTRPGNYLGTGEDNTDYTIMSYYDGGDSQARDWFGMYDLLALKTLYGANAAINAGNTVHKYTDASGERLSIIDDASGSDLIDLSGLTISAAVDLRPGAFSSVGRNDGGAAVSNLSIDILTTIENVLGTAYSDHVVGNHVGNRITLGGGSNYADGQGGIDTAVYAGTRGSYSASHSGGTVAVTGNGVNDKLHNVERVEFSNAKLAFDLAGNAGTAAKLIGAVVGSSFVRDAAYVKEGLAMLDGGWTSATVADVALDFRLGTNANDWQVVNLLYTNLTGRAPDAATASQYTQLLANGTYTHASLALYAADTAQNLGNIDFAGLSTWGLAYA
jgi:hypothetical protein